MIAPDAYTLLHEIVASPTQYGIYNTADWARSTANSPATLTYGALLCNAGTLNAPGADQLFMFADGVHPSTITQQIFGDYVYSIVVAPTAMSMLAETAVRTRSGLDEVVLNESTLGGDSGRYWVALDGAKLEYGSGADVPADGTPVGITIGLDRRTRLGRLGLAVNLSQIRPSLGGLGSYRQEHQSLSVYGSHAFGGLQLGLAATLGHLSYDTRRNVALGSRWQAADGVQAWVELGGVFGRSDVTQYGARAGVRFGL